MSGSVPSGRSPFPASRNPRNRSSTGSGIGIPSSAFSTSLGGDSMSSRGSNAVGGIYPYGNSMALTGMSNASAFGMETTMDTSVSVQNPSQQQHHSPMFHSMLRFSPNNMGTSNTAGNSWSPLHRANSVTNGGRSNRNRFFETAVPRSNNTQMRSFHGDNDSNGDLAKDIVNDEITKKDDRAGLIIDGIPIDSLRSLSQMALHQSPDTAVFYTGILFAKTGQACDALLLARAHYGAEQYSTCLRILDENNLLHQEHPWDAVLVACLALKACKNWVALAEMLEDVCRIPDSSCADNQVNGYESGYVGMAPTFRAISSTPLEDDDTLGWLQLKQFIDASSDRLSAQKSFPSNGAVQVHQLAQLCDYRAESYYEMSCINRAVIYWKRALQIDCQCQVAWEALLKRSLLTPGEAYDWIANEMTFEPDQEWLRSLFLARIELTPQRVIKKDFDRRIPDAATRGIGMHMASALDASSIHASSPWPSFLSPVGFLKDTNEDDDCDRIHGEDSEHQKDSPIEEEVEAAFDNLFKKHKLQESPQVLAIAARRSYRRYEWNAALAYCEDLAQLDPTVSEAAFCYIATLVVLGYKRTLFRIAHEWVASSPKSAQAWFAVGAYYYCIKRYHVAQRHFCRATRLEPQCTEAWIAFGCSFASCDESDQALASYRAAQRLSPGEHTSLLYMGMEYVRTNHLVLASQFLNSALNASGGDPLCLHELGVLASHKGEHKNAIQWFLRALTSVVVAGPFKASVDSTSSLDEIIDFFQDAYWEPTLFNLGHSYRKTRQFEKASMCFHRCVGLCPEKHSTYAALAFTKQLMGCLDDAISFFHQALSLKSDDPFSTEMLNRALHEQTTTMKQSIFDLTKPSSKSLPPLTEATNLTSKDRLKKHTTDMSSASSMLFSPNLSMNSSSRVKDERNSMISEEMDCDPDLSGTS